MPPPPSHMFGALALVGLVNLSVVAVVYDPVVTFLLAALSSLGTMGSRLLLLAVSYGVLTPLALIAFGSFTHRHTRRLRLAPERDWVAVLLALGFIGIILAAPADKGVAIATVLGGLAALLARPPHPTAHRTWVGRHRLDILSCLLAGAVIAVLLLIPADRGLAIATVVVGLAIILARPR